MSWSFVVFDIAKSHFVSEALRKSLLAEAEYRRFGFSAEMPTATGGMDLPGMCLADRGYEEIPLPGGLTFSIPYSDFAWFKDELENLAPRTFGDDGPTYYKLHGWRKCLVLTPAEREAMLAYMRENLEAVKAKNEADWQRWREKFPEQSC